MNKHGHKKKIELTHICNISIRMATDHFSALLFAQLLQKDDGIASTIQPPVFSSAP